MFKHFSRHFKSLFTNIPKIRIFDSTSVSEQRSNEEQLKYAVYIFSSVFHTSQSTNYNENHLKSDILIVMKCLSS